MKEIKQNKINNIQGVWGFFLIALTITIVTALGSYNHNDPSFSKYSSEWGMAKNLMGYWGSFLSDFLFQVFGYSAWLLPLILTFRTINFTLNKNHNLDEQEKMINPKFIFSCFLILTSACLFIFFFEVKNSTNYFPAAGITGESINNLITNYIGEIGTYLFATGLLWIGLNFLYINMSEYFFLGLEKFYKSIIFSLKAPKRMYDSKKYATVINQDFINDTSNSSEGNILIHNPIKKLFQSCPENLPETTTARKAIKAPIERPDYWVLPEVDLLKKNIQINSGPSRNELIAVAEKIITTLDSFDIRGEIKEITPGPIITMYEFQPAAGIRLSKLMSASVDLAMNLGVPSVRIVAPIPGKSVAGIEVPNLVKQPVLLGDVYNETVEQAESMTLPLPIGKDTAGIDVIADLAKMPHLLIGGATSMGKSVFVNSLLVSLLCRFNPDELKLIIVDPKLVEFKIFENLPHLLLPIVNDSDDASQALKWAVSETKKRYELLQKLGAKNITSYNEKVKIFNEERSEEEEELLELSFIVIIIDELAELMLTAKKSVEQSIVRLTQLARAAGIHLIMATQRPSADVVTGLIKSNCPARASLRVASSTDSRIILDATGAEQLIGQGDLFFTNSGPMGMKRVQGPYVSDEEIEEICLHWEEQGSAEFNEEILNPKLNTETSLLETVDSIYPDVMQFAKDKGKISTSLIQRKFSVGYTRAARIMEQLEENGIVSDVVVAGKPRDVLI